MPGCPSDAAHDEAKALSDLIERQRSVLIEARVEAVRVHAALTHAERNLLPGN